jgi:hypothetical protein
MRTLGGNSGNASHDEGVYETRKSRGGAFVTRLYPMDHPLELSVCLEQPLSPRETRDQEALSFKSNVSHKLFQTVHLTDGWLNPDQTRNLPCRKPRRAYSIESTKQQLTPT